MDIAAGTALRLLGMQGVFPADRYTTETRHKDNGAMRDEFFQPKAVSMASSSNVICPYCKDEYQPEAEDYSEDTRTEECFRCKKKFHLHQVFSVDHHTKPDCELNGEAHEWDTVSARHPDWQSCSNCDEWRRAPASPVSETNEPT